MALFVRRPLCRRRIHNNIPLESRFRTVWTVLRVLVVCYYLVAIPFRTAFYCDGLYHLNTSSILAVPTSFEYPFQPSMILDWICDVFIYVDILLTVRCFVQRVDKELIYHPKLLWRNYCRFVIFPII